MDIVDNEDASRDLDETRRLLYMALAMPHTEHHETVGTLINALAHHQGAVTPEDALDQLVAAIEETDEDAIAWVHGQIDRITSELTT